MRKHVLIAKLCMLVICVLALPTVHAQRRLLVEVKQDLNALTLTVDSYQNAINKLKPALTNDETKEDAETWYVAGKIAYSKYDKYRAMQTIGKSIDEKAMGSIILEGYDYMQNALKFDSVPEKDKNGTIKINKNTGLPKVKTKYSEVRKIYKM